jgi:hypothetical protein
MYISKRHLDQPAADSALGAAKQCEEPGTKTNHTSLLFSQDKSIKSRLMTVKKEVMSYFRRATEDSLKSHAHDNK